MADESSERIYTGLVGLFGLLCLGAVAAASPFPAQDGLSFVAATELALAGETGGYPSPDMGLTEPFLERYCEGIDDCEGMAVPFVSPPPMLLMMAPLVLTGVPILLLRLLGALSFGVGAWLLYGVLREHEPVRRAYPLGLILMLPLALRPIENGQNSPWLFLTLAVGLAGPSVARAVLVALVGLAKVTPWAMSALFLSERDWRGFGVFGAILVAGVAGSLWVPEGFPIFFERLTAFSQSAMEHPENVSPRASFGIAWFAVALFSGLFVLRDRGPEDRWALAWLLWLVAIPLVWTHYLWVAFGAVWWLVGRRVRTEPQALGIAAWCVAGSWMGPYTAGWLVVTWFGTLAALLRLDAPEPTGR